MSSSRVNEEDWGNEEDEELYIKSRYYKCIVFPTFPTYVSSHVPSCAPSCASSTSPPTGAVPTSQVLYT